MVNALLTIVMPRLGGFNDGTSFIDRGAVCGHSTHHPRVVAFQVLGPIWSNCSKVALLKPQRNHLEHGSEASLSH